MFQETKSQKLYASERYTTTDEGLKKHLKYSSIFAPTFTSVNILKFIRVVNVTFLARGPYIMVNVYIQPSSSRVTLSNKQQRISWNLQTLARLVSRYVKQRRQVKK